MLVLSRKESQRNRLGDSIVVTIVKISGDKVRIGIEAPTSVLVLRDELEAHCLRAGCGRANSPAKDSGSGLGGAPRQRQRIDASAAADGQQKTGRRCNLCWLQRRPVFGPANCRSLRPIIACD